MKYFAMILSLFSMGLFLSCNAPLSSNKNNKTEIAQISAADIGRRIEMLSSDEFAGRAPGTTGGKLAAEFIAEEMKTLGLSPAAKDGSYFQPVTLTEQTMSSSSTMTISKGEEVLLTSDLRTNSVFWTKRLDNALSLKDSELVFVGYGVVAPEYDWNDYKDLDVNGKTVVMLVNDPGFATEDKALFKGKSMTYYGRWTYKFEEAGRQGAAAALIIHETEPASYPWEVVSGSWTGPQQDLLRPNGGENRTMIEGWLYYEAAKALFESSGLDIEAQKLAAQNKSFKPTNIKDLKLNASIEQSISKLTSHNIVGQIKGTDMPDEYVLYMGHWDHLGYNQELENETGDGIFNGAVDNATGISSILEIAKAFDVNDPPRRSVIFLAVTAEESGLLGSGFYASDPIVPFSKTVAGINIDGMLPLGRTKDMKVIGFGASELEDRLDTILQKRDMYIIPDPKPEAGYFYRSDHISLAKKGVPMLFASQGYDHRINGVEFGEKFSTEYNINRYHKPADEYDNSWDLSGIAETAEIYFELGYELANNNHWPNWYEGNEFRAIRDNQRIKTK